MECQTLPPQPDCQEDVKDKRRSVDDVEPSPDDINALNGQISILGQVNLVRQLEQVRPSGDQGESGQDDRKELDHTQAHGIARLPKLPAWSRQAFRMRRSAGP